ncbi:hypothetical protein Zmor_009185 [Zophobas morio]|uniref:Uncharacterized protein n=1 Tax=Zophobas morio TaxID=2755281 RepID=A0AA38IL47_9CUCU|nr:hypothetical protein Zmor_009185 [Zophobas morio]
MQAINPPKSSFFLRYPLTPTRRISNNQPTKSSSRWSINTNPTPRAANRSCKHLAVTLTQLTPEPDALLPYPLTLQRTQRTRKRAICGHFAGISASGPLGEVDAASAHLLHSSTVAR